MMTFPTEWKNKTCSKPPPSTSWIYGISMVKTTRNWDMGVIYPLAETALPIENWSSIQSMGIPGS